MLDNIREKRIILASGSPRRQSLLRELGIPFEVVANHDAGEDYPAELKPEEIPVFLARKKADSFSDLLTKDVLLITADTIVWCNGQVLHKPADRNDAIRILKELSGNRHTVITGVCIRSLNRQAEFHVTTEVYFAPLTGEEIRFYLDRYQPYDKAGAYGIQEWIGYIGIEKIEGSYFNVMGLPIHRVYSELKKF